MKTKIIYFILGSFFTLLIMLLIGVVMPDISATEKMEIATEITDTEELLDIENYDECISDDECRVGLYIASQKVQTELVKRYGNDIPEDQNIEDVPVINYDTEIETLTNGDLKLKGSDFVWTKEMLEYIADIQKRPYMNEIRNVFSKYLSGQPLADYDETLLIDSNEDNSIMYGLSSFDDSYYKSDFIPYAIYEHYLGGYDLLIIFDNKPDKLFRAWVDSTEDENGIKWKLRMFQDTGIPEDEVRAIAENYKLATSE